MKKRLWSILLTACLLVGLLPTTALAETMGIDYLVVGGELNTCSSATEVASEDHTWGDDGNEGWYVVQSSAAITGGVTISGDVYLILTDGCTLTVEGSIQGSGNLTIYGQIGGTGRLIVNGSNNSSSCCGIIVNNLTINSGSVTATGGTVTGGDFISCGISAASIVISGGHVIAQAPGGSALNKQPTLPATYWWRTSKEASLTKAADKENEYSHGGYTYVEIWDTAPASDPAALTGTVTISGTTKYGGVLTATVKDSNNTGALSYQWKRGDSDIVTNSQTYTLVKDDIGSTITVTVTSDIQTGTITSDATPAITKADGPAAPSVTGVKPSVLGASDGKITGTTAAMEYSTDSGFASSNPCSAGETTGLSAGTYYVRVKATATHEAGAYAAVTVPAGDAALTYSIGLDVSGTHTFAPADVGYGAQTSRNVTVSNTGTGDTGDLSVALSGTNADAFTVSKTSISSIAPGGTDSFTVVPNTGLPAGTYTATVTVDGTSVDAKSFVVSFTVSASAAVAPDHYVFNISEGTIRILDGDTAGTIKVAYGSGKTTPDFDPSQEITVTGSFVDSSKYTGSGKSLRVETDRPVKIRIRDLTIDNDYVNTTNDATAQDLEAMVLCGSTNSKANVTLTLEGTNFLRGGEGCGGIEVGDGHTLIIQGDGVLTAQGNDRPVENYEEIAGAGIGGHHASSSCGTVIITGGTVAAIGGSGSAGIGGGYAYGPDSGIGGTVKITGGTVKATGGDGAAGIGGGENQLNHAGAGLGGNVTITGGNVTATAGIKEGNDEEYEPDAIGSGRNPQITAKGTGKLTVNGNAWVTWTGTSSKVKTLTQGVVNGSVYGNVTLTENRTLTSGFGVLSIRSGTSLTIPEGRTLTMADSVNDIYVHGTLTNYGTLAMNSKSSEINLKDGTLTNYGTLTGAGSITPEEKKLNYAAPPSAPEIVSVSSNSITLKDIPGAEYSKDSGATWQTSPTFDGLTTETEYTFYARYAGNGFYHTSAPSEEGTTQYTAENAPAVGEGFSIDYARQRITLKDGYEASWTNFGVPVENGALLFLGKNIYIRKAASGDTPASPAMANKIPDRPAAPTGVAYAIDYVNEKLSYDYNTYRVYRIIFGEEQTVISGKAFYPGETYYVCTRAVEGQSFESKPAELPLPGRPDAPDSSAYVINFSSKTISFDDSLYEVAEYNRTGITIKPKTILNGDTVTLGKTLRIYKKAVAGVSFKSSPLIVDLPDRFDTSSGGGSSSTTTTAKNPDGSTTTTVTDRITGTVTETTRNTDGSVTTVETKKNGTVTETTKTADGTTGTVVTAKNGTITEVKASISSSAAKEAFKNHETVTLPVEVPAAGSTKNAPAVDITVPKGTGLVRVEIPVEDVTPGTVAVIVKADGTEEIVSTSMVTENGIALTLTGSTTVKIIDNAKSFTDVPASNVFYSEVCSLSAREIMIGTTGEKFDLYGSVTLNQLSNVAGRITGAVDVKDYNGGIAWGQANGLKTGNASATRGDMLSALYNAAGSPAVEDTSSLSKLKDASAIPDDMKTAAAWALQNGVLKGTADGKANLSANVTRGQACALAGRTLKTLG